MLPTLRNAAKIFFVNIVSLGAALFINFLGVGNESIIMIFLLNVLFTAVLTSSRGWAISSAIMSAMFFNFLFTEPRFSFFIYSTSDLVLLLFFLVTGIVSGTVTSRLQIEMNLASQNEKVANMMYVIASGFLSVSGKESVIKKARDLVKEYAGVDSMIHLGNKVADPGFEINGGSGSLGKMEVVGGELEEQKLLIVQAVCTQLGIALERENLVTDRERIRIAMEREQQRSTFLRSVAHDLRSPLTALSGAGNLLADSYNELSDSERRKLASDISEEIVWLTDLVENILNMTRISENKIVLHKQEEVIDDVIGEAVKHTDRLLRGRNFKVILPDEIVTVPIDSKLISQVIINLLENAVRHTTSDSSILLKVEVGENLKISVEDTGNGIPESIREHIFERFVTKDEKIADGSRGLGLGLSICKSIVEAHGGEIFAIDNIPRGSIFVFSLPMEGKNVK